MAGAVDPLLPRLDSVQHLDLLSAFIWDPAAHAQEPCTAWTKRFPSFSLPRIHTILLKQLPGGKLGRYTKGKWGSEGAGESGGASLTYQTVNLCSCQMAVIYTNFAIFSLTITPRILPNFSRVWGSNRLILHKHTCKVLPESLEVVMDGNIEGYG